jgi:hypothetical protein
MASRAGSLLSNGDNRQPRLEKLTLCVSWEKRGLPCQFRVSVKQAPSIFRCPTRNRSPGRCGNRGSSCGRQNNCAFPLEICQQRFISKRNSGVQYFSSCITGSSQVSTSQVTGAAQCGWSLGQASALSPSGLCYLVYKDP